PAAELTLYVTAPCDADPELLRRSAACLSSRGDRGVGIARTQGHVRDRQYENGSLIVTGDLSDRVLRQLRSLGVETPMTGETQRAGWKGV
ncbi:MAG: hypothetical protein HRU13_05480, partial [Phycisphaerales bacterium]|nr:hypothetical protein [Phycisphaerales bacterium]